MCGAAFLGIDVDPERIKRRVKTGYCDVMVNSLDEALRILKNAVRKGEAMSVGLVGNCADLIPEMAQRGVVPERHGPWDARPNSTMTNGYVENVVASKDGETLIVKYKDGEKKIIVTKDTVITAVAPGKKEELVAGTPIIIMASEKQTDGSVLAKVLYVGRSGPPAM